MFGNEVTIIGEVGSVHDGSIGNALMAIEALAGCGCDVVKFQTHFADAESLPDAPTPPYFKGEPRTEYFSRTAFDEKGWKRLIEHCDRHGVRFLSSPFSIQAVDFLESLGVDLYKIPSGEVSNLPLLERIAATGKHVFLSSGMSDWRELDAAVQILKSGGPLAILQCSSAYPCPPDRVGLNVMVEMKERYDIPVGLSDHTLGYAASISAVALGAEVVEKHFTFSRLMYGSDAAHSLEPNEFEAFCAHVKEASIIQRTPVNKNDLRPYEDMKKIFEKSVVTARALRAGDCLTMEDLAFKKPGDGISASRYSEILGRELKRSLGENCKIVWDDLL